MFPQVEELLFAAAVSAAIVSSVAVVKYRSLFYAAVALAILGSANAVLFALLGFVLVSVVQVLIYVGATAAFVVFAVLMFKELPELPAPIRATSAVVGSAIFATMAAIIVISGVGTEGRATWDVAAMGLLAEYWLPLLVVAITLTAALVCGVAIASGEGE